MAEVRISAEPRTEFGKGASRRIRRANQVPAVLYGHGGAPRHISLPAHELMKALKSSNVLLSIDMGGTAELAIPKDVQRDPIRGVLEHIDLLVVIKGEKVKVEIPLHVIGQAAPDTFVVSDATVLEVFAEATHIPDSFDVSIEGLQIGSQIHAKDVVLPAGVELAGDPEQLIVNVSEPPREEPTEAAEPAEVVEAAVPAAPAE